MTSFVVIISDFISKTKWLYFFVLQNLQLITPIFQYIVVLISFFF